MPAHPGSAWGINVNTTEAPSRSFLGSIRKQLGRKKSNASQRSNNSTHSDLNTPISPTTPAFRGPADLNALNNMPEEHRRSVSPMTNPSPATRRPPGINEPPPAYTPSPTTTTGPTLTIPTTIQASELAIEMPDSSTPATSSHVTHGGGEDPYSFLGTFDTTLLIDDSGSMAGRSWREVAQALRTIAPIVTRHDSDGIDVYFLNHKSSNPGSPADGVAPGGYRGIKRAATITEIFERVRPQGGTPTGIRVHNILKPYLAKLEKEMAEGRELKPLNLIVLTDGVPSDDVESVLISAAKKLDKLEAPPFQVGVQFFQVGNEEGAKEALEELDDGLSELVEGGIRDMVDTVTWSGGASSSEGGVGLTGDGILKAVSYPLPYMACFESYDSQSFQNYF